MLKPGDYVHITTDDLKKSLEGMRFYRLNPPFPHRGVVLEVENESEFSNYYVRVLTDDGIVGWCTSVHTRKISE